MLYTASRHGYSEAAAVDLVTRLRFGILVSVSENEPQFSHVPVIPDIVDGRLVRLRGHLSRANPHWKALQAAPKATFVFNGANTYISAQWYLPGTPAAPTWGYAVVHVGGAVRLAPDDDATSRIVDDLIRLNEAVLPKQWPLESYSPARRAALLPHIIGFELDVTSFTPKYQIIQAHSDSNKRSAAAGLTSRGTDATREIAELILSTCSAGGDNVGVDLTQRLREREEQARRLAQNAGG